MKLYGPYKANIEDGQKKVSYQGNKIYSPIANIAEQLNINFDRRVFELAENKAYAHLHRVDNAVFFATIEYFKSIGAEWCNLPLTTLMISSPGEVYAGKILNYTTDALPVDISWFDNHKQIFLSESSQFYLELRLLVEGVDKVFSIYNSFRKEKADFSHLSEFQHIEFEGHVTFDENVQISLNLLKYITEYLLKNNRNDLIYFLTDDEVASLENAFDADNFIKISFKESLDLLYKDTNDLKYLEYTLKHFGSWEEIRLTEVLGKHAIITEYPVLEIPFYHNELAATGKAENADIVLYCYREVIGSGKRIVDSETLLKKSKVFNLPAEDYAPYLESRRVNTYRLSSGFGMGWQRFTHWLLKLPTIIETVHIPRGHWLPKP